MNSNINQYIKLLEEFVAFESVSTLNTSKDAITAVCNWLTKLFASNQFSVKTFTINNCNPIIYADYKVSEEAETWLVYGHYDVQPAKSQAGWVTNPFKLTIGETRLTGRGAMDNKGQILIHMFNIFELLKHNKLNKNIKFIIEGEEETGSAGLIDFVKDNVDILKCDQLLISDGNIVEDWPVVEVGFRGVTNGKIILTTANNAVHSGEYANAIPNATHELAKLVSKIFSTDDLVNIPGFYDGISIKELHELPGNKDLKFSKLGVNYSFCSTVRNFHYITGILPALSVTGLKGGYIEEGYANIVPNQAEARFNFRFGIGQNPTNIIEGFKKFIKENKSKYSDVNIEVEEGIASETLNIEPKAFERLVSILTTVYGKAPILKYVGGTLPIINSFKKYLEIEPLSIPLANEDSNMHGANENISIQAVEKGLKFSELFFS